MLREAKRAGNTEQGEVGVDSRKGVESGKEKNSRFQ
jgi:hypothetical protein